MSDRRQIRKTKLEQIQLLIYLLPVVGLLPAFWTLYRHSGNNKQQAASRLSIVLGVSWLVSYCLLWTGAVNSSELSSIRFLYSNALLTSGYFLTCIMLMFRFWQGKSLKLPGIGRITDSIERKN